MSLDRRVRKELVWPLIKKTSWAETLCVVLEYHFNDSNLRRNAHGFAADLSYQQEAEEDGGKNDNQEAAIKQEREEEERHVGTGKIGKKQKEGQDNRGPLVSRLGEATGVNIADHGSEDRVELARLGETATGVKSA
ncbi:unnamed protein product, partial [Amoebophrya sp. A25]|eukprot:GSA25T00024767001.1